MKRIERIGRIEGMGRVDSGENGIFEDWGKCIGRYYNVRVRTE